MNNWYIDLWKKHKVSFFILIFLIVLGLYTFVSGVLNIAGINLHIIEIKPNVDLLKDLGNLGQYFGGTLGVIVSTIAIILIYQTYVEQKLQNRRQTQENDKRDFENSFFEMLKMLHEMVNNTSGKVCVNYPDKDPKYEILNGQEFFSKVLNYFKIKTKLQIMLNNKKITDKELYTIERYEEFHIEYAPQLGHYFRYIYNIFKFIYRERAKYEDKKKYIDLIQAQISTDQMGLIFYNAKSKYGKNQKGYPRFFNWLESNSFLENINVESLIERGNYKFYPKTKFKFLTVEEKRKAKIPLKIEFINK
jgi:hypothetical protein